MTTSKLEIFEHNGCFVLAYERNGAYIAPWHNPARGGLHATVGSLKSITADGNVYCYASRTAARRALKRRTSP